MVRFRGALRRRKPQIPSPEKARAFYLTKERSIQEMSEEVRRERERLVKIDPIYKFLFLDRTAPDFDDQVEVVIEQHKVHMQAEFERGERRR